MDRLPGSVEQVLVRNLLLRPEHRIAGPRALVDSLAEAFGEKPRYTDRQVAGIVARAAELDALPTQSGNLSLGGIQQLAADVGIPPPHVERAAGELAHRPAARLADRGNAAPAQRGGQRFDFPCRRPDPDLDRRVVDADRRGDLRGADGRAWAGVAASWRLG